MKTKKILSIIFLFVLFTLFCYYVIISPLKIQFDIKDNKVFYTNNSYIYASGNKIYQMNGNKDADVIYQTEDCYSIYCDDEYIYVVEFVDGEYDPFIVKLDKKGNVLKKSHPKIRALYSEEDIRHGYKNYNHEISIKAVIDDRIYAIEEHEGVIHLFDKDSLESVELKFDNEKRIDGGLMVSEADDMYYFYYCNNRKEIQIESIVKDDIIYKFMSIWGGNYCNGKYFINDSPMSDLLIYDLKSGNIEMKEDFFEKSNACGSTLLGSGVDSGKLIFKSDSNVEISHYDDYKLHDFITILDADTEEIVYEHKTRINEIVVYADAEKAVTYYHDKYIVRSLKDWKKLSSQKASEIKKDGKYSFDACGDYVFVFDENTGKLLNKI